MTKSTPAKLKFMAEYQKTPANEKKRVERNRARRHDIAKGLVSKGDGMEVDHKVMLDKGGSGADSNTRVVPAAKNRGWRKANPGIYGKGKS